MTEFLEEEGASMYSGMNRSTNVDRVGRLLLLFIMVVSQNVFAKSVERRGDAVSGKLSAPTVEDHAAYFATENYQDVSPERMAQADELRIKTISSIKSLLQSKKKSIRRFELMLRLGELYVERHDYLREIDMSSYEKSHNEWQAAEAKNRGREPNLDVSKSQAEMTKAINSFRRLVNEFPKHRRTDAALFSLAKTLGRQGKATAANYYKQLLKSHPRSPLIPDAKLALGEFYFDRSDVGNAVTYYKQAMKHKKHEAYPYAVYKLGWAFYNQGSDSKDTNKNYKKAVTAFKLVVKLSDKDKNSAKRGLDLKQEAIKDLIMVWAEAGDVRSAWRYFRTIGEKKSFYSMLERLGQIYYDQGKNVEAIALYEKILNDAPLRSSNPKIHATLAELHDRNNQVGLVVKDLNDMTKRYLGKTRWTAFNKDKKDIAAAKDEVEHKLHFYGTTYHQRGQKAKSKAYMASASTIYSMYLDHFADKKNSYDIRYYLAEILYDTKKFDVASDHYLTVAKTSPKGKYAKPSALNAVASMNQYVNGQKFGKLPPAGQVSKPISIPPSKKKLMNVMSEYVKLNPKEKDGNAMKFATAQINFDYGHYDVAIQEFNDITKTLPNTKEGKSSARVILGYYTAKEDWSNVSAWCRTFEKRKNLLDKDLQKHVASLLHDSMFKQALVMEKASKFKESAAAFVAFQTEFPRDKNADRALFNASLNYYKIGELEKAIAAGLSLKQKYPKSDASADNLANLATSYESLAQYENAAKSYKGFFDRHASDKRAPGALFNSALLYKGLGNKDLAVEYLDRFVKFYPKHSIASDAYMELGEIYENNGKYQDARNAYREFSARFPNDITRSLLADARAASIRVTKISKEKGESELNKVARKLLAKDSPAAYDARRTVAKTMFQLIDRDFGDYMAYKLDNGKMIEKQVGTKQAQLVRLAKRYQDVISLGSGEYSVASLYRLGEAHENFSKSLFAAPAPKGASQKDVDNFKTELEKVAFPLKNEAYSFYETAFKRSTEVQTFTAWTQKSYDRMVELSPDKHPQIDVLVADPTYLSQSVKDGKQVAELIQE